MKQTILVAIFLLPVWAYADEPAKFSDFNVGWFLDSATPSNTDVTLNRTAAVAYIRGVVDMLKLGDATQKTHLLCFTRALKNIELHTLVNAEIIKKPELAERDTLLVVPVVAAMFENFACPPPKGN